MANITLLLNSLLVFLLILEDRFVLPGYLQVAGRMHPLVLHFPIVLLVIYALYNLFIVKKQQVAESTRHYADMLLLFGAFTAAVSALMGLFLSREEGYDADALQWHKWSGAIVSLFALAWYYGRKPLRKRKITRWLSSVFAIFVLIITGHQGANITHGEDFLFAPLRKEESRPNAALAEAMVFDDVVKPIIESKCINCHNSQKAKGELILETHEQILKGGKSGLLWETQQPGEGLLMKRLLLPVEDKKHMPPKGKPQLTEQEIEIIKQWIEKGANFNQKLIDLPVDDKLYQLAAAKFESGVPEVYSFASADVATVQSLNTENRVVLAEALNSPALTVSFFNSTKFQSEQLKELSKIKEQIVSLDLTRMPLGSDDMKTISQFTNLRRLHLGFTPVKAEDLKLIKELKNLRTLTLSGTNINASQLAVLKELPKLSQVYTWQMPGSQQDWEKLINEMPAVSIESGFAGDSILLQLSPPIFENEITIISEPMPLKLKHYIQGAEIRYTLDGSEPDSIRSLVYKGDEVIDRNVLIRAKAFKAGWISSEIMEASLYKRTFVPDTIYFLTAPEPAYTGTAKLLTDLVKGETNFRDGNWIAWRNNRMELLMPFSTTKNISSVTLGGLTDVNSYIMPPQSIEVWGGDDPSKLKKLGSCTLDQPKGVGIVALRGHECRFETTAVKYLKIIAQPVSKLPSWHPGKGDKGWLFVDEVLLN
ncbi:MAG: chitobiase/beta-hexosaminidase C-terminal domain-containing protein [Chitinophagaceae bacterium]|nr:chitobiase/beta-hexosaminidase C-terminal domain-containing protein [Chitinophagaceae bacterium]